VKNILLHILSKTFSPPKLFLQDIAHGKATLHCFKKNGKGTEQDLM
jgi:hypothetical protein